jgi:hypothetical protein
MGFVDKIKDVYYSGEEKWYRFWDKVDSKIPVYKIIDPIDSVAPTFAIFLILLFILIIFLLINLVNFIPVSGTATFEIINYDGNPFAGKNVFIELEDGKTLEGTTNNEGVVVFTGVQDEMEMVLDINTGDVRFKDTFFMSPDFYQTITLTKRVDLTPPERTIILQNELGIRVQEPVELIFYCQNAGAIPNPQSVVSDVGVAKATEPFNCGKFYVKPVSDGYESKAYEITTTQQIIQLKKYEPPKNKATIKIRDGDKTVTDTSFNITLSGKNTYTGQTNSNSQAIIDVVPGVYSISVSDPSGSYGIATSLIDVLEGNGEVTVSVSKTVKAKISVTVKDSVTGALIEESEVALTKGNTELARLITDETGKVSFSIVDTGKYSVTAKKVGDVGVGYFAKTVELDNVTADVSTELGLEKITVANAGKVKVLVIDQDKEPVQNTRVILKYVKDDSIVELNSTKNYALTDINGYAELLAGLVEGEVVAYATKYPFSGTSKKGIVAIDKLNEFTVEMEVGSTNVTLNVTDKDNEPLDAIAEFFNSTGNSLAGLVDVQRGIVTRDIKSGTKLYIKISAEGYENYITAPVDLWPDIPIVINVHMKNEIFEPSIDLMNIYTKEGKLATGLSSGQEYYAKFLINSDDDYSNVDMHFRVGTATHATNDYMEIIRAEGQGVTREMRGLSYDPILGYEYDSENFTTGNSKWITLSWNNFEQLSREVTVHFKIKPSTPPNKELQFFWRASFDDIKKPGSTESEEFYSDTYFSKVYYEGAVPDCLTDFCISSEWLYSSEEELYMNKPYELKQVADYKYHFQILNNSTFNYTLAQKPIYLYVEVVGNNNGEKMLRIKNYEISDTSGRVTGGTGYLVDRVQLNSFETQTVVDIDLDLEGIKAGGEIIRVRMQSEGTEIFSQDLSFNVLSNKELTVSFDPTRIPSLINTEITVKVSDKDGEPVDGASLRLYAKEPGYDEYDVDLTTTNRLGTGILNSGAFFSGTKLYVEIQKLGFARALYQLTITDLVATFAPQTVNLSMNTVSARDVKESVEITNQIIHDLELYDIILDSSFEGLIKESAFKSYFEQFEGEIIEGKESEEYELIRAQLSEDATPQSLPDGHSVEGKLIVGFKPVGSNIIYDAELPLQINISSDVPLEAAACMQITNATQTKVTQTGKVTFNFELANLCQSDNVDIGLDSISASTTSSFNGQAEITLQSMTTSKTGRSALSSTDRQLVLDVVPNEVFAGTVTYVPNQSETGDSVKLTIQIKGLYGENEIVAVPGNLDFTVDVINLRECVTINSDASPVAFDSSTTITIDATACKGQAVDIQLCKGDARCAGGIDGGITLSSKTFTLKGESKTIEAYSPSLPGTYGVTVHARQDGTGSFTYIGEAVVGFEQDDNKRFQLNKTDFALIGEGSQDSAILTNTLLLETVTVKANDCIWGVESVSFDWAGALTGAMIGASIGSMVGGAFGGGGNEQDQREETGEKANASEATNERTAQAGEDWEVDHYSRTDATTNSEFGIEGQPGGVSFDTGSGQSNLFNEPQTVTSINGNELQSGPLTNVVAVNENTGSYLGLGSNTYTVTTVQGDGTSNQFNTYTYDAGGNLVDVQTNVTIQQAFPAVVNPGYTVAGPSAGGTTYQWASNGELSNSLPPTEDIDWVNAAYGTYNSAPGNPAVQPSFDFPSIDDSGVLESLDQETQRVSSPITTLINPKTIKFASVETVKIARFASGGRGAGYGALIGAVAGALIMGFAGATDCSDTYSTADYTDFITFLQGDQIQVYNTQTNQNELKTIPSDAGSLSVTMGNTSGSVSASWDFDDADYSTQENVGINFTNNGMNDPQARYGLLTIQATEHIHGDYTHSDTSNEFDVLCQNGNFANYWIGGETEDGLCSGISTRTYSQQYHIRVTSAEPQDNAPYLRKSSSCYVGTLAGSTGKDAMPKIQLNWDWDSIAYNSCDYGNPNYIYCDATQFSIALVKRLALIKEFLDRNPGLECPPNRTVENIENELSRYNTGTILVSDNYIGVQDINVLVNHQTDVTTVTVSINNRTGGSLETNMTWSVKGEGEALSETITETFPSGESEYTFEVNTPEWDGVYMATATFNGPSGNRRAVTKAFLNTGQGESSCWAGTTTESLAGLPAIYYYLNETETITYTNEVQSTSDLLDLLVFRAYLIKDNFSDDFKNDFKRYYTTTFLQSLNTTEQEIIENFDDFDIYKKYTNETEVIAGLYYVWLEIDMGESFQMFIDNETTDVRSELLLIKNPPTMYPFYNIPFNGELGFDDGRESYGVSFENEDDEIILNNQTIVDIRTFNTPIENGHVKLITRIGDDIKSLTSGLSTRGQLMSVTSSGSNATLDFTPNYATPVISRTPGNSGSDELFAYQLELSGVPQNTGGNMNYWTGAAQSYDFYGAIAADMYYDAADYQLDASSGITEPGVTYGFSWADITRDSTLYLKTIFYTPVGKKALLKIDNGDSQLWTPNQSFGASVELNGISGMNYNDASRASNITSVQELLDLVESGKVCITNDGSNMKFWWNPRVISVTAGSTGQSLEGSEASLIGG